MKKHIPIILCCILASTAFGHAQMVRQQTAKVTGVEVTYQALPGGLTDILYQPTDEGRKGFICQPTDTIVVDYVRKVSYNLKDSVTTTPIVAHPSPDERPAIDGQYLLLGWDCVVRTFGDYLVYYTTNLGFAATPAPSIAAPENGVVVRIEHKDSPLPIYRATSIRQITY